MFSSNILTIFILALLTHGITSQQVCTPNLSLPNTVKQTISFSYHSTEQTYTYPYVVGLFSSTPSVVMSVREFNITKISTEIGYYLRANFSTNTIGFTFNAPNVQWAKVGINFWLTSRADIYVGTISLEKIDPNTTLTTSVILNSTLPLFSANNTQFLPFITSLNITSPNSNFSISCQKTSQTNFTYILTSKTGLNTSLVSVVLTYIVYNPQLSSFASNGGTISYQGLQGSQYSNIHNNIMPIYYMILGFSSLALSPANAKQLEFKIDLLDDYVLEVESMNIIDSFTAVVGTIGVFPVTVCAPCNNFIFENTCVNSCPPLTYQYSYTNISSIPNLAPNSSTIPTNITAKSCLICSKYLNQMINELSTGCICIPGYQMSSGGVCSVIINPCTGANQININGTCVCAPGTVNISGICGVCPSLTVYNGTTCIPASPIIVPPVLVCTQPNQIFNSITGACQCTPNFFNISGACAQCTNGTAYNGTGCSEVNCGGGSVLVNGKCICLPGSIKTGNICTACSDGLYADQFANLCIPCLDNCFKCTNKTICLACLPTFTWSPTNSTCYSSAAPILLRSNSPQICPLGIVTDIQLPISAPYPVLSSTALFSTISYTINDTNALPSSVYFSQNPSQGNIVRALFTYTGGLMPITPFQVGYTFTNISINLQTNINVTYDMKGPIQFTLPNS